MPDEVKTCSGSLVLDLRIWWRHVHTLYSQPFVTIPASGATKSTLTFQEARMGLIIKRPNCQPTGTHLFLRYALVWKSANSSISFSSTSMPTLCTHWSLTGNTAPPHWVVTHGRRWLAHRPPCSTTVPRKGSMLCVLRVTILKQESAFLVTTKMTAATVVPESGFGTGGYPDDSNTCRNEAVYSTDNGGKHIKIKPWVTSWCSDKKMTQKRYTYL